MNDEEIIKNVLNKIANDDEIDKEGAPYRMRRKRQRKQRGKARQKSRMYYRRNRNRIRRKQRRYRKLRAPQLKRRRIIGPHYRRTGEILQNC